MDNLSRRNFIRNTSAAAAGIFLSSGVFAASGFKRIKGANERINFGVIGLHGRGHALLDAIAANENTLITHICDVDQREFSKFSQRVVEKFGVKPVEEKDFRKLLEIKDIDVIVIATPEHWHAPMAIMALQAGKHVYVEKPCSHNPREGEILVEAQSKYGKLVQMGNQQRSSQHTIEIINKIHNGLIGEVYYGKAWYTNSRGSIGIGKQVPVPDYLDWELWQGPAPRVAYKDNIHPYNWHWFWNWGTGETLNNGTHEVDICRWALNVNYPNKITSSGGRYHYTDDWEFYDTLITNFEYNGKMISWEGKSCNNKTFYNRGRGALIQGTIGSVIIDRDGYELYDNKDVKIESFDNKTRDVTSNTVGGGEMTDEHFRNFINAIRKGEKLNSPIDEGNISVTMLQLSNIAWKTNSQLEISSDSGHIMNNTEAAKLWGREYEKDWEPKV
jgi:predicted dehydrogenase